MSSIPVLRSFHIIEKYSNEKLITWTFPTISSSHTGALLKVPFLLQNQGAFFYSRSKEWFYIHEFETETKRKALCIIATDYNPDKYETLSSVMIKRYQKTEDPVSLVKLYLDAFVQGTFKSQENGTFITYDFTKINSSTNMLQMIRAFGPEVVLIYTGLLLKKRIVVYHNDLRKLQKGLLSITKLMEHRDPNHYLYPCVEDIDVQNKTFFLTGTTNVKPNLNLYSYDLHVDLVNCKISIMEHAKETFALTRSHKDLGMFLVQLSENSEITEAQALLEVNNKTQELLTNLRSLATVKTDDDKKMVTIEMLRSKKLSQATENFLFNLAVAENVLML